LPVLRAPSTGVGRARGGRAAVRMLRAPYRSASAAIEGKLGSGLGRGAGDSASHLCLTPGRLLGGPAELLQGALADRAAAQMEPPNLVWTFEFLTPRSTLSVEIELRDFRLILADCSVRRGGVTRRGAHGVCTTSSLASHSKTCVAMICDSCVCQVFGVMIRLGAVSSACAHLRQS